MTIPDPEQQVHFCVAPAGTGDNVPLLFLGVPEGAWEYMKDGKTHTFDLTKAGLGIKLVLFGGKDHAEIKSFIEQMAKNAGLPLLYKNEDYSIQPPKGDS